MTMSQTGTYLTKTFSQTCVLAVIQGYIAVTKASDIPVDSLPDRRRHRKGKTAVVLSRGRNEQEGYFGSPDGRGAERVEVSGSSV